MCQTKMETQTNCGYWLYKRRYKLRTKDESVVVVFKKSTLCFILQSVTFEMLNEQFVLNPLLHRPRSYRVEIRFLKWTGYQTSYSIRVWSRVVKREVGISGETFDPDSKKGPRAPHKLPSPPAQERGQSVLVKACMLVKHSEIALSLVDLQS